MPGNQALALISHKMAIKTLEGIQNPITKCITSLTTPPPTNTHIPRSETVALPQNNYQGENYPNLYSLKSNNK